VGVAGAERLHPAKPKAMVRAVTARIAREVERFLVAYIRSSFSRKHLHCKTTLNHGIGIRCEAFVQSFILERTAFSTLLHKTKGRMEGDLCGWWGKCGLLGLPAIPVTRLKGEMERGRQPNSGGGHPPRKGNELLAEVPGVCWSCRLRARTRIWKLSYNSGGSRFRI
jgi:hypothetical protein